MSQKYSQDEAQALVKALKEGNQLAFSIVYKTYAAQTFSLAFKYLLNKELAEDAVQNLFLKLWLKKEEIDVWDSWPVQDAKSGVVSNWNGYQLVISMAGAPNKNSNHIYLLYSKYGDNDFTHWKNAGPIFGYNALEDYQQWSGSATGKL